MLHDFMNRTDFYSHYIKELNPTLLLIYPHRIVKIPMKDEGKGAKKWQKIL